MDRDADSSTSLTLLGRLRQNPDDQTAWREFVDRYGRKIYRWCCQWGVRGADADDVAQEVLVKVYAKMRTFVYDPSGSFRGWLRTVARHALADFREWCGRVGQGSGDSQILTQLETVEAREDLRKRLEEEFDLELLEAAKARVRLRVEPDTWDAFRLVVEEGLSADEVARRVHKQRSMVLVAVCRVKKLLQEEIQRLEGPPAA